MKERTPEEYEVHRIPSASIARYERNDEGTHFKQQPAGSSMLAISNLCRRRPTNARSTSRRAGVSYRFARRKADEYCMYRPHSAHAPSQALDTKRVHEKRDATMAGLTSTQFAKAGRDRTARLVKRSSCKNLLLSVLVKQAAECGARCFGHRRLARKTPVSGIVTSEY